jgi:hypothetical protein
LLAAQAVVQVAEVAVVQVVIAHPLRANLQAVVVVLKVLCRLPLELRTQ